MKYIITESQFSVLNESFSIDDMKNWFKFITKVDKKKHFGADTFKRYSNIKKFQKFVDLIFKYTKKTTKLDGVDGLNVATVWVEPEIENLTEFGSSEITLDFLVRVYPQLNNDNPPKSQEDFQSQYVDFQKKFETIAKAIDIESIRPVETPNVQDVRIRFNFMNIKLPKHSSEIKEEELTEKCWPGYTQKGMKTMFGKRYPNCVKKTKK